MDYLKLILTPLPVLFCLGGLIFLLIGAGVQFKSIINTEKVGRKTAYILSGLLIGISLFLYICYTPVEHDNFREQKIKEMDSFVYIYKPRVEELPTGKYEALITKMNSLDLLLQNFHNIQDEQERAKMYENLRNEYAGTSTNVIDAIEHYKIIDLTE